MEITWTRTKTIVSLGLLVLALAGVAVKHFWFPTVDDRFFQLDYQRFQRVPAGLFVLRKTHFSDTSRRGCMSASASTEPGKYAPRFVGRNATLGEIFATAYQCRPSQLVLPPDLPADGFDLLVTVPEKPLERLQARLKSKFGCTASWQEHSTAVWQLEVNSLRLPASAAGFGFGHVNFKNGRLVFTHMQISQMVSFLENQLGKPVEDNTGLDGFYDYSFPWGWRSNHSDETALTNALAEYGLGLTKGTDTLQMMVVMHDK